MKSWLLELNPDVNGEAVVAHPADLLRDNPEFLKKFNLIILNETTEVAAFESLVLNEVIETHQRNW